MDENLRYWFKGFENALTRMNQKERETLFCACGQNCADRWVMNLYKDLFNKVGGDMDQFFIAINNAEGVKGEVVETGRKYRLSYQKCFCGMHLEGYLNSPHLCECSRQSIIYVLSSLMPQKHFDVEVSSTIVRGGDQCQFAITMRD